MITQLYRHFDAEDRLLYIGISRSAVGRLIGHKRASHWFESICRVEIENYDTRAAALRAEKLAIRHERPLHNLAHSLLFRGMPGELLAILTGPTLRRAPEREIAIVTRRYFKVTDRYPGHEIRLTVLKPYAWGKPVHALNPVRADGALIRLPRPFPNASEAIRLPGTPGPRPM